MKIFLLAFIGIFTFLSNSISNSAPGERNINSIDKIASDAENNELLVKNLYDECNLTDKLDYDVFKHAMDGYNSIDLTNRNLLSIIDYSKPSSEKRFFIIDIENHKLIYQTLVAHGKKSGYLNATKFSNKYGTPSQFTANPISVLDFSSGDEFTYDQWDIGSKHIVILFGENHDSEFYYRIVIYNDKYPTKVDGKEIKRQNKIREIQKEKEKYQF